MAIFPQAARLRLAGTEEFLTFDCEFVVVIHVVTTKTEKWIHQMFPVVALE